MEDGQLVADQLDSLAESLGRLDIRSAARLNSLGLALRTGTGAPEWATVQLSEIFDPNRLARQLVPVPRAGLREKLDRQRGWFVLLPISALWVALTFALPAYHELLIEKPELRRESFLYLWQGAFDGRLPWYLRLSDVAQTVAALLLLLLLVTILTHGVKEARELRWRQAVELQRNEIASLLADATVCLSTYRMPQDRRLIEEFEKAARSLVAIDVIKIAEQLRQTTQDLAVTHRSLLDKIGAERDAQNRTAQMVAKASDRLLEALNQVDAQRRYLTNVTVKLEELGQITHEVVTTSRTLMNTQSSVSEKMEAAGTSIEESAASIKRSGEAFSRSVARLNGIPLVDRDLMDG